MVELGEFQLNYLIPIAHTRILSKHATFDKIHSIH